MAKIDLNKVNRVHDSLVEHVVNNKDRYYRLAYSFVKNEEAAGRSVCEAIYFSLYNARKMEQLPPKPDNWFLQLVLKSAMREMRRNNYERQFTYNSKSYAYMETLEHSMTNVFKLYYFEDLNLKDIEDIIGLPEKQILAKLNQAIEKIGISPMLDEESEEKLREMTEVYSSVEIPENFIALVEETIKKEEDSFERDMNKRIRNAKIKPIGVVALAAGIFFLTIILGRNNKEFADSVLNMPLIGNLFKGFLP